MLYSGVNMIQEILANNWVVFGGSVVVLFSVLMGLKELVFKKGPLKGVPALFWLLVAIYVPSRFLDLPQAAQSLFDKVFFVLVALQAVLLGQSLLNYSINKFLKNNAAAYGVKLIAMFLLWSLGAMLVLSNLGFNVTSLVASLGIGGIAVALAVQNILSDIFSAFSIYFDKPFEVGDVIVAGADTGTVKKIGLKTTRLQTLQGEELIIPNKELTASRLQNLKRMEKRRVAFMLSLAPTDELVKLKEVGAKIGEIIAEDSRVEFGRCHLKEIVETGLNYEIVYFVKSAEYAVFMDVQQKINFGLLELVEKEGLKIAFKTTLV